MCTVDGSVSEQNNDKVILTFSVFNSWAVLSHTVVVLSQYLCCVIFVSCSVLCVCLYECYVPMWVHILEVRSQAKGLTVKLDYCACIHHHCHCHFHCWWCCWKSFMSSHYPFSNMKLTIFMCFHIMWLYCLCWCCAVLVLFFFFFFFCTFVWLFCPMRICILGVGSQCNGLRLNYCTRLCLSSSSSSLFFLVMLLLNIIVLLVQSS